MPETLEPGYGQQLRTSTYTWLRPFLGMVLLAVWMLILSGVVLLPVLAVTVALDHHGTFAHAFSEAAKQDHVSWQSSLYLNLVLASLIPVVWGLLRYLHGVPHRYVSSERPGIRWRFLGACLGLAVVAIAAQLVVGALLPGDPDGLDGSWNDATTRLVAIGIVVLLTTPLQAAGEEWGFRGYALQAFAALSRRPWVGVLVSALLFALAHGVQNAPLFIDRFAFGLTAGYLVLRTRGLEAGIALHVWNNLVAFGLALTLGNIDDTLKIGSVPWSYLVVTATQNGVYLVLVLWVARRMGITSPDDRPVLPVATTPV